MCYMKTAVIKTSGFDFLDFGASKAESLHFGVNRLGGKRGLGVDLDPKRVAKMKEQGLNCVVGDITNLAVEKNAVRFVKMVHILEHLPSLKSAQQAIATAKRAATDFIVINGPFFDEDEYLKNKKLKLEWSDYPEHTLAFKVDDLVKILDELAFDDYEIYMRYKIKSSDHPAVLPLKAPPGTHGYDSIKHIKKPHINFERDIWMEFVCYIPIGPLKDWQEILSAYQDKVPYIIKKQGKSITIPQLAIDQYVELYDKLNDYRRNVKKLKDILATKEQKISMLQAHQEKLKQSLARRLHKSLKRIVAAK
jgi:hypothetical protein